MAARLFIFFGAAAGLRRLFTLLANSRFCYT